MKVIQVGVVTALLSASFLLANISQYGKSSVMAKSEVQSKTVLPSFLEKGKTYHFYFAYSVNDSTIWLVGKVEKLDADAGWVYVSHYVSVSKGKTSENRLVYSWINMNQVYQCSEVNP